MHNELWTLLEKHHGWYEFKDAVVHLAMQAIEKQDINILYQEVSTFNATHPEDAPMVYPAEAVTNYVKKTGVEKYVKEKIEKN